MQPLYQLSRRNQIAPQNSGMYFLLLMYSITPWDSMGSGFVADDQFGNFLSFRTSEHLAGTGPESAVFLHIFDIGFILFVTYERS